MQHEHHHAPAEPKKAKIGLAAPDVRRHPSVQSLMNRSAPSSMHTRTPRTPLAATCLQHPTVFDVCTADRVPVHCQERQALPVDPCRWLRVSYALLLPSSQALPWPAPTQSGRDCLSSVCGRCALFDFKCSAAEKALKAGASVEH